MKELLLGNIASFLFYKRRFGRIINKGISQDIRVLAYHHLTESCMPSFARQLEVLKKYYNFLDPAEFFKVLVGGVRRDGINLVLTFDDGFASNRWAAEHILKPMGMNAIFFVPSEFIRCGDRISQEKYVRGKIFKRTLSHSELKEMLPMSWDDLKWLLSEGHMIGSHTRNHVSLDMISNLKELEDEVINGGVILAEKLGVTIECFAYPFGKIENINKDAMGVIRRNYKFCFSGIRGKNDSNTSPYGILRDIIEPSATPEYVRFIIEGGLDYLYKKKALSLANMIKQITPIPVTSGTTKHKNYQVVGSILV